MSAWHQRDSLCNRTWTVLIDPEYDGNLSVYREYETGHRELVTAADPTPDAVWDALCAECEMSRRAHWGVEGAQCPRRMPGGKGWFIANERLF